MGQIRTLGLCTAIAGEPTPAVLAAAYYTSTNLATPGVVIVASTVAWAKGICTIVLGAAMPANGYNPPNNAIQGNSPAPNGQQVTLWGFGSTVGLLLNGKKVTVIANNPAAKSFSFYFAYTGSAQAATADAGSTAPSPAQHYRVIRLECSQALSTDLIYVGDSNVSSTQYMACLSLTGQLSIEIASENVPVEEIFIDTSGTSSNDAVMVTLIN